MVHSHADTHRDGEADGLGDELIPSWPEVLERLRGVLNESLLVFGALVESEQTLCEVAVPFLQHLLDKTVIPCGAEPIHGPVGGESETVHPVSDDVLREPLVGDPELGTFNGVTHGVFQEPGVATLGHDELGSFAATEDREVFTFGDDELLQCLLGDVGELPSGLGRFFGGIPERSTEGGTLVGLKALRHV